MNRHEAFRATEVARVLTVGGRFVTEQDRASGPSDLRTLLGVQSPVPVVPTFTLELALTQLQGAGLLVVDSGAGEKLLSFHDVGALAWYVKAVPWELPGFTIAAYRQRLAELHQRIRREGPLSIRQAGFWVDAIKPR